MREQVINAGLPIASTRLMMFPLELLAWKGNCAVKASQGRSQLVKSLVKLLKSKIYYFVRDFGHHKV